MAEHEPANEGEPAEAELPRSESGLAAVALALARGRRSGAKADARMDAFIERQTALADAQRRLAELQMEHLHEERALHHRHSGLKYFSDRLRVGLQLLGMLAGLVVVVAIGALAWQAHDDHGLAVDAFSVPPDLAHDGLAGEVVAARFLDKLQAMQAATRSERPAATYQNNWGSDVKIDIPETGLTFGQFERLLRDKLGHETHVTGELIKTPTGISLTARFGADPPKTFSGAEADLDTLAQQAAEAVYRVSQPYRYSEYLQQNGRNAESLAVAEDLARTGPPGERAWADVRLANLALERGDVAAAHAAIADGLAAGGSGLLQVQILAIIVDQWTGHDEQELELTRLGDRTLNRKRNPELTEAVFQENRLISPTFLAGQTGDYATAVAGYRALVQLMRSEAGSAGFGLGANFYDAQLADELAFDHDVAGAEGALAQAGTLDGGFYLNEARNGWYALPTYQIAVARGDWAGALVAARAADALIEAQKSAHPVLGLMQPVLIRPLEARALAYTGDLAGAEALIATTPLDCYLCVRVRGEIAATRRDWPAADRWYADAARQAPDIPFAFEEWGRTRLARGDLAAAVAEFQTAHGLEPRFADPLKDWGDALASQGRWKEALGKYDEALKDAPAWRELIASRNAAARRAA